MRDVTARGRGGLRRKLVIRILCTGLAALLGCLVLLAVQIQGSADRQARQDVATQATQAARAVSLLFDRWHDELLLVAGDHALTEWYTNPERRAELRPQIEASLVALHTVYPTLVDEACYIDATGPEVARQVKGQVAPISDLSADESDNPFFGPTFATTPGQVWQNTPYVSPDSNRWVISNSTPIVVNGTKVALLHFESNLEAVRAEVAAMLSHGSRARIIDTRTGNLIADTGSTAQILAQPMHPAGAWTDAAGPVRASSTTQAAERNANTWRVEVSAPRPNPFSGALLLRMTGLLALAVIALALVAARLAAGIAGPIRRVIDATRNVVTSGDRTLRVGPEGTGEIRTLSESIDEMLATLEAHERETARAAHAREEQMHANYAHQRAAEVHLRDRAQALIDEAVNTASSELSEVSTQVTAVHDAAGAIDARVAAAESVTGSVVHQAEEADRMLATLGGSLREVRQMAALIEAVTAQTNLLALNATIEAARAGEAGRGFSIVAREVKELADATKRSTIDITRTITSLENDAASMARALSAVTEGVDEIRTATARVGDVTDAQRASVGRLEQQVAGTVDRIGEMRNLTDRLERRRSERVAATGVASGRIQGRETLLPMVDISRNGLRCSIEPDLPLGMGDTVELELPIGEDHVRVRAEVIRKTADGHELGMRFVSPDPASARQIAAYVDAFTAARGR